MNNMQVNISSITNGFLVMTPPKQPVIQRHNQPEQQPQPDVMFCDTKDAVCKHLMEVLPND